MYARVAAFENSDTSKVDEMIANVEERADIASDVPDAKRILILLDREGGTSLGLTFFETEEAIRQAEPAFERMGDEIPEETRGKRTSVEVYEVVIEDIAEGAKAARVSSLEGPTDRIDDGLSFIKEQIIPAASDISGWRGIVTMVDRTSGRAKTITFWDSEESRQASETLATTLRNQAAEAMDDTITGVDRYEVALSKALAPTTA